MRPVSEGSLSVTFEIRYPRRAAIDRIEVGRRVSGPVRLAFEVADSGATAEQLTRGGAEQLAEPVVTPWRDRNVRLRAPGGMQLTLFSALDE